MPRTHSVAFPILLGVCSKSKHDHISIYKEIYQLLNHVSNRLYAMFYQMCCANYVCIYLMMFKTVEIIGMVPGHKGKDQFINHIDLKFIVE